MPMFHMEHCVFSHVLSDAPMASCGRPCDRHRVETAGPRGEAHPLVADVGCRNTVFNARPAIGGSFSCRDCLSSACDSFEWNCCGNRRSKPSGSWTPTPTCCRGRGDGAETEPGPAGAGATWRRWNAGIRVVSNPPKTPVEKPATALMALFRHQGADVIPLAERALRRRESRRPCPQRRECWLPTHGRWGA